jgi:hypothetical protein
MQLRLSMTHGEMKLFNKGNSMSTLHVVALTLIIVSIVSCVKDTACEDIQGNSIACLKAFNDKALKEHK